MDRRTFLQKQWQATTALAITPWSLLTAAQPTDYILGHGSHRYRINHKWGNLNPAKHPVKDCHEMVVSATGKLYLLTNETRNNILVYDRSGQILDAWGQEYPGAHGLTLHNENGTEFLYLTDYERHQVYKTTLDGRVILTIDYPKESGHYTTAEQFKPTETAIAPNGDIYVADGYGEQWITVFDEKGRYKFSFGGKAHFQNAHGIALDTRKPDQIEMLITARAQNALKRFSLEGEWIETINLPGAFINRPVVAGKNVYLSVLKSEAYPNRGSGFILILDENNRPISCPAGSTPRMEKGQAQSMYQTIALFRHPHDVCVDADENLYIPQWNSGQVYPIKLERI